MSAIDLAREAEFAIGPVAVKPALRLFGEEQVQPRVMQVLVALARRADEVVSRDDLIEQCWDGRAVGEDAVQRAIAKARELGESSGAFAIETIARVGYRLTAQARAAPRATAEARAPTLAVLP